MSSELGSVTNGGGYWDLYSASKAALNMLMKGYAARHANDRKARLLMAPGWVRTDLGGSSAPLSIEQSIPQVVDTVEASRGRSDLRFVDRWGQPVPW